MDNRTITVIDETIREGMQHRGIVFSREQREKILEFQEKLGVDICQAGYAPAHITEQENIMYLNHTAKQRGYKIRIAGMGRATVHDVEALVRTGISDFHLHAHINEKRGRAEVENGLEKIKEAVLEIRNCFNNQYGNSISKTVYHLKPTISVAVLDIGTSSPKILEQVSLFLANELCIDILSLPDTSGIMSPDAVYDVISLIVHKIRNTQIYSRNSNYKPSINDESENDESEIRQFRTEISVHCHNDLGMASANTFLGVKAGATLVELSVLGIGERNGIGDLFTVAKMLKTQGYKFKLAIDDIDTFTEYYIYVSNICKAQNSEPLINYNTPFFGSGVRTHVAGTHAGTAFGLFQQEEYYLNILCGKKLVKRYLDSMGIPYVPERLHDITEMIKSKSAELGRRLAKSEIVDMLNN